MLSDACKYYSSGTRELNHESFLRLSGSLRLAWNSWPRLFPLLLFACLARVLFWFVGLTRQLFAIFARFCGFQFRSCLLRWWRWNSGCALPFLLAARRSRNHRRVRRARRGSLGSPSALGWRWRGRRRGRREWFQEFQGFGSRTQFAVQQQHEHVLRDLGILRQLRCDVQLRHLWQRNLLLHLAPLGEKVLYLLYDRLLSCGD